MIPKLGVMHWLTSFMGCIGALIENSGHVPWLECAFAGVPKIVTGKEFPINDCALIFIVLELMRGFADDLTSFDELQEKLDSICQENILAEHWVKNLIRSVFLMMLFIRTEREGEFTLKCSHISFFHMSKLPPNILVKGEHALYHKQRIWNGIWSDMMIETMFIKFEKGPGKVQELLGKQYIQEPYIYGQRVGTNTVKFHKI